MSDPTPKKSQHPKGVFAAPPPAGSLPPLQPKPTTNSPIAQLLSTPAAARSLSPVPDDDPVARLFSADQALPLPALDGDAESGRWQRTSRSPSRPSLFDQLVADPPPVSPEAAAPPVAHAPPPVVAEPPLPSAAPPVPAAARKAKIRSADVVSPKKPAAPPVPAPARAPAPPRPASGPSTARLVALGMTALLVVSALAVLLGGLPNPFKDNSTTIEVAAPSQTPARVTPPVSLPVPSVAPPVATQPQVLPRAASPTPTTAAAPTPPPLAAQPKKTSATSAARAENPEPSAADALVASARKLLADEDAEGAEKLAREALVADPNSHHAMELLARALMEQDRGDEALPLARKIVQRRGRRVVYRLLYGDLLLMTGNEAAAKAEWQAALALSPADREIKRRLQ